MKRFLYVFIGSVMAALSLNVFLLPSGFAPGGVSGLATVVNILTHGLLPVGTVTFVLNIPLFILGYKILGKKFILRSLTGTLLFSVMTDLTAWIAPWILRWLDWPAFYTLSQGEGSVDYFLYAVCGGLLFGLGLGMIFRGGATTGGTDIAARILQRKFSWLTLGQLVLFFDVLLLVVVAVTYRSIIAAIYSGVVVFVASKVIDVVEAGVDYAKNVMIVLSDVQMKEELAEALMISLRRGVTGLSGEGMHSGKTVTVLMCVVGNRQLPLLRSTVAEYDRGAFLIISNVREIGGRWREE